MQRETKLYLIIIIPHDYSNFDRNYCKQIISMKMKILVVRFPREDYFRFLAAIDRFLRYQSKRIL